MLWDGGARPGHPDRHCPNPSRTARPAVRLTPGRRDRNPPPTTAIDEVLGHATGKATVNLPNLTTYKTNQQTIYTTQGRCHGATDPDLSITGPGWMWTNSLAVILHQSRSRSLVATLKYEKSDLCSRNPTVSTHTSELKAMYRSGGVVGALGIRTRSRANGFVSTQVIHNNCCCIWLCLPFILGDSQSQFWMSIEHTLREPWLRTIICEKPFAGHLVGTMSHSQIPR